MVSIVVDIYKLYRYNQIKDKKALIFNYKVLENNLNSLVLDLSEVTKISYIIKHTSSYLLVKLKDDKAFIQNQKKYKRLGLHFNNWRFKTPFVINLEFIEGEADVNYKKIESFIDEHNLISINY